MYLMEDDIDLRKDGRTANQLRPLLCVRGLLSRSDGSARWSHENTTVLAAIYGPRFIKAEKENMERVALEVIWKPQSDISSAFEREAEGIIRQTFDSMILPSFAPRKGITLIVQVIHDDGGIIPCAINAAMAALVDACIPMTSLLSCIGCALMKEGEIVLDPTKEEEDKALASIFMSFPNEHLQVNEENMHNSNEEERKEKDSNEESSKQLLVLDSNNDGFVSCSMKGPMTNAEFLTCIERCKASCSRISTFSRISLEKFYQGRLALNLS